MAPTTYLKRPQGDSPGINCRQHLQRRQNYHWHPLLSWICLKLRLLNVALLAKGPKVREKVREVKTVSLVHLKSASQSHL